jgi:16S rRNA processing protein RimM
MRQPRRRPESFSRFRGEKDLPVPPRLIPLGIFGAPHGVKGQVRVKSYTQDPMAIGAYGALTDGAGRRSFALTGLRSLKDDLIVVGVAGVTSRDAAARLNGVELFARREQLPPPADDEFYHQDLIGLEAVTREGVMLGRVVALHNFGAGDIVEIAPAAGGDTFMLPFTKAVAPWVDLQAKRIVIVAPREVEGEAGEPSSPAAPQQNLSEKEQS